MQDNPPATSKEGTIILACPACKKPLQCSNQLVGKQVRCPACKTPVAVRTPAPQPPPDKTVPDPPLATPMKMLVHCPSCQMKLQLAREHAGKKISCPSCKKAFVAPSATAPVKPPPLNSAASEFETLGNSKPDTTPPHESPGEPWTAFLGPAQAPDELGRLGQYRVLRVLGKGGMGVVFSAEDPLLQRPVALKVMLPTIAAHESARQRFLREARSAAAVRHDHVVTIHQVGEDRGVPFLAMEFLEGEPLDAQLRRLGRLPLADAVRIAHQTAEGLAAAHAQGLIHRDVKPANIWLVGQSTRSRHRKSDLWRAGRVKILDFGLARAARDNDNLTQSGTILGTPAYMAPEQAKSRDVDARADLFSLGCVLYHMLTGQQPFAGDDVYAVLLALALHEPPPPHVCDPFIPRPLSDLVMKLLAKDPNQRHNNASEVAESLELIAEDRTAELHISRAPAPPPATRGEHITSLVSGVYASLLAEGKKVAKPRRQEPTWLKPVRYAALPTTLLIGFVLLLGLLWPRSTSGTQVAAVPKDKEKINTPSGPKVTPKNITNAIGMQFVLIPGGEFKMGSPHNEPGRFYNEEQHEIGVDQFYMGVHEVSQAQYEKVMAANPSAFGPAGLGHERVKTLETARLPVENITWKQAAEFCDKLSSLPDELRNGRLYRLPTEAEWEYACRGGYPEAQATCFGERLSSFQANFNGNFPYGDTARGAFLGRPAPVGTYPANRFGLFDMHGNVAEWCANWDDSLCLTDDKLPAQINPDSTKTRGLRGGSWAVAGRGCRTASRIFAQLDDKAPYWGFRVALHVAEQ